MKLLFDENLSERTARDLADLYPASSHVFSLGLGGVGDGVIWARGVSLRLTNSGLGPNAASYGGWSLPEVFVTAWGGNGTLITNSAAIYWILQQENVR